MRIQNDTHSAEPGHSQGDGCFEVVGTLLGQSGDQAGGCRYDSLKTDTHTVVEYHTKHTDIMCHYRGERCFRQSRYSGLEIVTG